MRKSARAIRAEGEAAAAVQTTSPTDLVVHAGFGMELATCPAGESNRARSLIGKALSKAPVELSSLDHDELFRFD
jgi:hypothetical protein